MRNLSYENEYDLHSNGLVSKTHFHMKGFALGLVLKQRQKRTRKWPIKVLSAEGRRGEGGGGGGKVAVHHRIQKKEPKFSNFLSKISCKPTNDILNTHISA